MKSVSLFLSIAVNIAKKADRLLQLQPMKKASQYKARTTRIYIGKEAKMVGKKNDGRKGNL